MTNRALQLIRRNISIDCYMKMVHESSLEIFRVPIFLAIGVPVFIAFSQEIPRIVRVNRRPLFVKIAGWIQLLWPASSHPLRNFKFDRGGPGSNFNNETVTYFSFFFFSPCIFCTFLVHIDWFRVWKLTDEECKNAQLTFSNFFLFSPPHSCFAMRIGVSYRCTQIDFTKNNVTTMTCSVLELIEFISRVQWEDSLDTKSTLLCPEYPCSPISICASNECSQNKSTFQIYLELSFF